MEEPFKSSSIYIFIFNLYFYSNFKFFVIKKIGTDLKINRYLGDLYKGIRDNFTTF